MSTERSPGRFLPLRFDGQAAAQAGTLVEAAARAPNGRIGAGYAPPPLGRDGPGTAGAGAGFERVVLPLTEDELARVCGAAAGSGRAAALATLAAERDRSLMRAMATLESLKQEAAQAFVRELDAIASHAAALMAAAIKDRQHGTASELRDVLHRVTAEALEETASCPQLVVHVASGPADALRALLSEIGPAGGQSAPPRVEVDPALPEDGIRLTWTSGWSEARVGASARLLRDRLAGVTPAATTETINDLAA